MRKFVNAEFSTKPTSCNLDVVKSVGYRVKSQRGVQFRIWAANILKEYIKKGFVMDDERLKELGGGGYCDLGRKRAREEHSSAAEYLTYVAAVGDNADSTEMDYEDENI